MTWHVRQFNGTKSTIAGACTTSWVHGSLEYHHNAMTSFELYYAARPIVVCESARVASS